jgi:hypothetical protein
MMEELSSADRHAFIEAEIQRAYTNADDEWKKQYYHNAARYLAKNRYLEGGHLCAFCRSQGMADPHHHNVWGSMLAALRKLGWIEKVGMVEPTTKHTHINSVCQWESKLYK